MVPQNISICMKNVTCTWTSVEKTKEAAFKHSKKKIKSENKDSDSSESPPTLNNISLEIKKGSLVGIIGHVGAGKSSLLQVILKELEIESGALMIRGKTAYTNQVSCKKIAFEVDICQNSHVNLTNTRRPISKILNLNAFPIFFFKKSKKLKEFHTL